MAGGARNGIEDAHPRGKRAAEDPARHSKRSAFSVARTRLARDFGQTRRPVRGRASQCAEKINRARARNLESTCKVARQLRSTRSAPKRQPIEAISWVAQLLHL